jgi:hypothetical protein
MTAHLDWETFVSGFYPGSARHNFRVPNAYDAYRKSLRAEQSDRSEDAEALRSRDAASSQLGVRCPHPPVVDPRSSS